MSCTKKIILITGCSSGIGLSCAHYLQNDFHVIATARKLDDVERLTTLGFESYLLDVNDFSAIDTLFELIQTKHNNRLFAIFNNAGYGQPGALEDISPQVLQEQFQTNVFGLLYITQKAIAIFRQNKEGRIIQHSSVLGLISLRYRGAYNASKYAIEGLCDTLRLELADTNIFISTLNTGPIRSEFRNNALKKFTQNIDTINSHHKNYYEQEVAKRLQSTKDNSSFTKDPIEVAKIVRTILVCNKPKPRYYITQATTILAFLKRILPTSTLDKILRKIT